MADISRLQQYANERRQSLLNALGYMKDVTLLTDVTLICNNKTHPAHRVMLAASSCYFRDIFQNKKKVSRINVHDVDEETFAAVLRFLYTGSLLLEDIKGSKLAKVLSAFRGLNVHCLDSITSCALTHTMDTNNFYSMWEMVKELQLKESEAIIVKYVASKLKDCCHSQYFPLLTLQQMISVLSSKHLVSGSSNVILEAVAMWGSYDQERRAKYLTSLLSIIGLTVDPKLRQELLGSEHSSNFLLQSKESSEICSNQEMIFLRPQSTESSFSCQLQYPIEIIKKFEQRSTSLEINFTESETSDLRRFQSMSQQSAISVEKEFLISELDLSEKNESIAFLRPQEKSSCKAKNVLPDLSSDYTQQNSPRLQQSSKGFFKKLAATYTPRSPKSETSEQSHDATSKSEITVKSNTEKISNEYLLFTATTRFGVPVQQTYNPTTKLWQQMKKSSNLPLDSASNFHYNRSIYTIGGETIKGLKINSAFAYNLENNTVKKLCPLLVARSEAGLTQLSGFIYVIGGRGVDNKPLNHVEFYCPLKDVWQAANPLNKARIQPNVAPADGYIYVVGGCCGEEFRINTTCECYDSSVNQWMEICPISRLHTDSQLLIANHQERIYAMQCHKPDKLFFYLSRQNKWVHMESDPRVNRVMSFISCSKVLWLIDRSGKILTYDDTANCWNLETNVPCDLIWPINVYIVDFC